jgi:hypothetical protein
MRSRCRILAPFLFVPAFACSVRAQSERILDFHSDITLNAEGAFLVRESITVNAAGAQIRHGMYRDFPTR